jgi:hypothetical protein
LMVWGSSQNLGMQKSSKFLQRLPIVTLKLKSGNAVRAQPGCSLMVRGSSQNLGMHKSSKFQQTSRLLRHHPHTKVVSLQEIQP